MSLTVFRTYPEKRNAAVIPLANSSELPAIHSEHPPTVQESNCQTSEYALSFHPPFVPL